MIFLMNNAHAPKSYRQKKHMMGKNRIKILKSASFLDNVENKT